MYNRYNFKGQFFPSYYKFTKNITFPYLEISLSKICIFKMLQKVCRKQIKKNTVFKCSLKFNKLKFKINQLCLLD